MMRVGMMALVVFGQMMTGLVAVMFSNAGGVRG